MRHLKTPPGTSRCGITSVLAMLYLILFASLALGFYASSNSATMVAHNELQGDQARVAAETGLEFMNFQLAQIVIPASTTPVNRFSTLANMLSTNLNGTANLQGKTVGSDPNTIAIPGPADSYIKVDDSGIAFRVTIQNLYPLTQVRVKVIARSASTNVNSSLRAVQMDFDINQLPSDIFNFAVATRGTFAASGSAKVLGVPDPSKGSILSTSSAAIPVNFGGNQITGDISVTNPLATVTVANGTSVGGTTDPVAIQAQHVHKGVATPEFPVVDTSVFAAYATNAYVSGQAVYSNVRVPPNTNPNFGGGTTVKGVLYIDTPNKVTFSGSCTIQGVVAVNSSNQVGNLLTNQIIFSAVTATGVETLPSSYGDLRTLTGSFCVAPGFAVTMSGGFGTIGGSIVADKLTMTGGSTGTLGTTAIILKDNPISLSASTITMSPNGNTNPAGMRFSSRFRPITSTYDEVKPF